MALENPESLRYRIKRSMSTAVNGAVKAVHWVPTKLASEMDEAPLLAIAGKWGFVPQDLGGLALRARL